MIIAFCGLKTSGKTTAAKYLADYHGFKCHSFAGPLKEACKTIFHLSDDQVYGHLKEVTDPRWDMTPRQILQRFGTEVGRQFCDDLWIKNMQYRLLDAENVVIDDCRFPNEAQAVKASGGIVVGVQRPGLIADDHPSELEMIENWDTMVDVTISNASGLEALYAMVEGVIHGRVTSS